MSVQREPSGKRHRDFKSVIGLLTETAWDHWPVKGPRTFAWCAAFIAERSLHPLGHHGRFLQATGLPASDFGAQEHEMCMRVMEVALCFDQLQGAELSCMEVICRKAQLIEMRHRDKVLGHGSNPHSVDDDAFLYLGTGATRGLLMICPLLEENVATELARETSAAKERRSTMRSGCTTWRNNWAPASKTSCVPCNTRRRGSN